MNSLFPKQGNTVDNVVADFGEEGLLPTATTGSVLTNSFTPLHPLLIPILN